MGIGHWTGLSLRLLETLCHFLWQGTAVALAVAAARRPAHSVLTVAPASPEAGTAAREASPALPPMPDGNSSLADARDACRQHARPYAPYLTGAYALGVVMFLAR